MTETSGLTTPDKILELAYEKEKQAHDFYEQLAAKCHVDYVRELLETLQSEESKHMHVIEEMKRRLDAGKEMT